MQHPCLYCEENTFSDCSTEVESPCLFPFVHGFNGKTYGSCASTSDIHIGSWCPTSLGKDGVFRKLHNSYVRCNVDLCEIDAGKFEIPTSRDLQYLEDVYQDYVENLALLETVATNGGKR